MKNTLISVDRHNSLALTTMFNYVGRAATL